MRVGCGSTLASQVPDADIYRKLRHDYALILLILKSQALESTINGVIDYDCHGLVGIIFDFFGEKMMKG